MRYRFMLLFLFIVLWCSGLVSAQVPLPCISEGDSYTVVLDHPECCLDLMAISCDSPDVDGICHGNCVGAMYCTYYGKGICGLGENKCNCPDDCLSTPAPEFASLGVLLAALLSAPAIAYLLYKKKH